MLPVISHHSQLSANVYPELFALVCISHVTNGKDYKNTEETEVNQNFVVVWSGSEGVYLYGQGKVG